MLVSQFRGDLSLLLPAMLPVLAMLLVLGSCAPEPSRLSPDGADPAAPAASDSETVAAAASQPAPPSVDIDALERRIHDRVNALRTARGRPALRWDAQYHPLARSHSRDMAAQSFFSHVNPSGQDVNDRAAELGLECRVATSETTQNIGFAENLYTAHLYQSHRVTKAPDGTVVDQTYDWKSPDAMAQEVVQGWLDSPGHRQNLLHPQYHAESIGVTVEGRTYYVTQVFC